MRPRVSTSWGMVAMSFTSSANASPLNPASRISLATASTSPAVRAHKVTVAAACAKTLAAAAPMPRPAPVMSAVLPLSRKDGRGGVSVLADSPVSWSEAASPASFAPMDHG
jgi:hypothetical protein